MLKYNKRLRNFTCFCSNLVSLTLSLCPSISLPYLSSSPLPLLLIFFNMFLQVSYLVVLALANKESNSQCRATCGNNFEFSWCDRTAIVYLTMKREILLYYVSIFEDILILLEILLLCKKSLEHKIMRQ